MSGKLLLIATPIGNLGDISSRVKQAIEESDFVLAEDTRVTLRLLNHLDLKKRLVSCHEHNERERAGLIAQAALSNQTVALISDAGTPLISDPGQSIVAAALDHGMTVTPIPGPSAFLLALVASGLPCERFVFEGFLPEKSAEASGRLNELKSEARTIVFYLSPHKLLRSLKELAAVLGENRRACLARELTKRFEEFVRLPLGQLIAHVEKNEARGEYVLVVEGAPPAPAAENKADAEVVLAYVETQMAAGRHLKEVSNEAAGKFGWRKADVYKLAIEHFKS